MKKMKEKVADYLKSGHDRLESVPAESVLFEGTELDWNRPIDEQITFTNGNWVEGDGTFGDYDFVQLCEYLHEGVYDDLADYSLPEEYQTTETLAANILGWSKVYREYDADGNIIAEFFWK